MNYIDGTFDEPYSTAESDAEQSAYRQIALDFLYGLGCAHSIKDADMRKLCELASIDFNELQKYPGSPATC